MTDHTTAFDAFPDAPTPATLIEALYMLAETRRLLAEAGVTVRPVAVPAWGRCDDPRMHPFIKAAWEVLS